MKRLRVDANVLLRFLTGEPMPMAEQAARLIRRAERGEALLLLTPLVVAEMVWVLKSFYRCLGRHSRGSRSFRVVYGHRA